jgi:hypothetical protein
VSGDGRDEGARTPDEVLPAGAERRADPAVARQLAFARALARLLDEAFAIPGTSLTIGLDPLVGLVPGIGDLLGAVASTLILGIAARLGAPASLLARMALNVAIDTLVGAVPIAGDLFDAGWKSNVRNVRLLETWLERPRETRRASLAVVVGLAVAAVLATAAVLFAGWRLVAWAARGVGAA